MALNSLFCADVPLSNYSLTLGEDEALCATCYTSLTVNHIIIECPQFNHLRQQYHFGSTLKDLFSNTSVNDIIAFIKDPQFYTRI